MESPGFEVPPEAAGSATETAEPPSSLPRGPHGLPRDVVVRSQRTRMLRALVEVVAEKGYVATTVADVIGRAGVSRTTFYEQFKDKEDCFLIAFQKGGQAQYLKVIEAVRSASDPVEQLRRNVRAYLAELTAFPASARAFLLEVPAAGLRALAIRDQIVDGYARLLAHLYDRFRERQEDLPKLPEEVFRAAVAAVDDLVIRWMRAGRVNELAELEPIAAYVELALFGLPQAAAFLR
ncbi:MAG TPA: TetR/AcrR family transcriptional regulator [Actinomycetes bacterium]